MFGRKKMYKKGLADAMQAYEAFGKKQEAALEHMREEVQQGHKRLEDAISDAASAFEGNINGLYDYLNSKEKAELYKISTPIDIKELPDLEKRFLLAILYQLADDEGDTITKEQQAYIRSVQRYLKIVNPQTEADLTAVDNIDSLDTQKAFLQVVLEFLYLQDGDMLSDIQEEFVSSFSVSKKQAELIEVRVSRLYKAVGSQGLAEKYGYVPDKNLAEEISEEDTTPVIPQNSSQDDVAATPMASAVDRWTNISQDPNHPLRPIVGLVDSMANILFPFTPNSTGTKDISEFIPIFRNVATDLSVFAKVYLLIDNGRGSDISLDIVEKCSLTDEDRFMLKEFSFFVGCNDLSITIADGIPDSLKGDDKIVAKVITHRSLTNEERAIYSSLKTKVNEAMLEYKRLAGYVMVAKGKINKFSDDKDLYLALNKARKSGWFDDIPDPTAKERRFNYQKIY